MPRVIATEAEDSIELGELIERLETGRFDARDEDGFAYWGESLKQLANNRRFLGDIVVDELRQHCRNQLLENQFTPQVILLHGKSDAFIIRANFWPAAHDSVVVNSGTSPFFYGLAHDHNFSFLTVGYHGPGYWSDYYEYDYGEVIGHAGEQVDLRFVERSKLDEGKVMLYRAHKDVHLQLPADAMSISLNILETSYSTMFRDQYQFDIEHSEIAGTINPMPMEQMLALSAHIGGEAGADLLERFAASHPSDRVRFQSLRARAAALPDIDARLALFEAAARQGNPYVSAMARREADTLQRSRHWIEGERLQPAA